MNAIALEKTKTRMMTTTLFDLLSTMQQNAATPRHEDMIVPTVMELLRSGRIRYEGNCHLQIADDMRSVTIDDRTK
ncbi:MAG: hypothetical protein ETSY1_38360 [Candidatus Entotheonella factor]|uniref:Uncharacterized protein n=1 Tax=Entotheonella factor TaxID=1429438 RepID=W4L6F7_ENTF1|nr:MAG: hypothetical protein ETSY1_38360 [Candidatus Entotheonella factor]